MRLLPILLVAVCLGAGAVPAWSQYRPANAPNWRVVDGRWVRPDRVVRLSQFVQLVEEDGRHLLRMVLDPKIEPMLANYRTAVVEMEGNPFAWKTSTQGRTWNFNRSQGTQHLQLIASVQDRPMPPGFTLTKIDIAPHASSFQATAMVDDKPVSVIVVLAPQFTELAVSELGQAKAITMVRSASSRQMLRQSPVAARKYLIPALQLLTGGENPLLPGAADVYRAFPVPPDPAVLTTVRQLLPRLAMADPNERETASAALVALGRRGVRAAMTLDPDELHPEAALRVQQVIDQAAHDSRPAEALRADLAFVIDATHDPDPAVRAAAGELLLQMR